jgi:hypothetical protein
MHISFQNTKHRWIVWGSFLILNLRKAFNMLSAVAVLLLAAGLSQAQIDLNLNITVLTIGTNEAPVCVTFILLNWKLKFQSLWTYLHLLVSNYLFVLWILLQGGALGLFNITWIPKETPRTSCTPKLNPKPWAASLKERVIGKTNFTGRFDEKNYYDLPRAPIVNKNVSREIEILRCNILFLLNVVLKIIIVQQC